MLFTIYDYADKMNENEMVGACNTQGRNEKCIQNLIGLSEENTTREKYVKVGG